MRVLLRCVRAGAVARVVGMTNPKMVDDREVVVRLTGVRKDFGDYAALDGVSLEIRAGESVAVMGPSGSGKSTLLNMVSGLDRPSAGSVVVDGEELGALKEKELALFRRRRIGMIFGSSTCWMICPPWTTSRWLGNWSG
jgi:putative ABC transport system ATP-binding protein